ncbi:MAG: Gfo/Idh/MocA family oxidoreductase [Candidatus Aminicenantales bacterium]
MEKNIALLGFGDWGRNLARVLHNLGALYAVCDNRAARLEESKKEYPEAGTYSSHKLLLEDPDLDAVCITTPVETHHALAKAALSAGKDVLVEKPLAVRLEDAEELVSLAAQSKRVLMVGHILSYHPGIIKLKELIDKGELGKILYIYSNRLNLGKFRTEENILWSFAPHDISAIIGLLDEMPVSVSAEGGNYLSPDIADVTVTNLVFQSGARAHIFVSWLHPYKEQKLVVIGDRKMALFDDMNPKDKLLLYDHKIDWIRRTPVPKKEKAAAVKIDPQEPLRAECRHFLECLKSRGTPLTDGGEALRVLRILEAAQESLSHDGKSISLRERKQHDFFAHETVHLDAPCEIGPGTKIWHFAHILKNTKIGRGCVIGQNASIGPNVTVGENVKIQNNVSIYDGVTLEDDVFCGPSMVFTNVINPRSHWPRKDEFQKTLVKKGASLGANSTIVCGTEIGRYAFVGAGAVVTKDVPDHALVHGVPARIQGWVCLCGEKLSLPNSARVKETAKCGNCGRKYQHDGVKVSEIKGE